MISPYIVPNSSHRGFINPGTGAAFSWGSAADGWGDAEWDDPSLPLGGITLDDFMQQVVAAIVGISQDLVRPRWQPEPPNLPPIGTNWAAIGVTRSTPLGFPYASENSAGFSQQQDQEEFDVLCSFYGPQADNLAMALRSGMMVAQNREAFQLHNMGLIQTSGRTRVPTLTAERWLMRVDITFTMNREVQQSYPVLTLVSAPVDVITDVGYQSEVG